MSAAMLVLEGGVYELDEHMQGSRAGHGQHDVRAHFFSLSFRNY